MGALVHTFTVFPLHANMYTYLPPLCAPAGVASSPMAAGVEKTPRQKFISGVKRAMAYGTVIIQKEVMYDPEEAAGFMETNEGGSDGTYWSVLFPDMKIEVPEGETSTAEAITELLASLSNTPEGMSLRGFVLSPFACVVVFLDFLHSRR